MTKQPNYKMVHRLWHHTKDVQMANKYMKKKCYTLHVIQFSSVTQSWPTLRDPMICSRPGLPVYHQLPEFTQTHVHWVGDAIQPSHPLSSPSPPAPNPFQHQGLFQWVSSLHEVAKVWEFQLWHQMQTKATVRYATYLLECPKFRTMTNTTAGEFVEQCEYSSIADRNANWHSHIGRQFGGFLQN